jgi:hypothetical protein
MYDLSNTCLILFVSFVLNEQGAFFHKHFRRGRLDLSEKMSCAKPNSSPSTPSQKAVKKASANPRATGSVGLLLDASASARDGTRNNAGLTAMMGNTLGLPQLPMGTSLSLLMQQQQQQPQQFFMPGFGMAMTPQQLLLQAQGMTAAQQQNSGVGGTSSSGDPNLDAAIEREVARRIQERLNNSAAALSRQPFVIHPPSSQTGSMTTPQNFPSASVTSQMQSILGGNASGSPSLQSMGMPRFGGNSNLQDSAFFMSGGYMQSGNKGP